MNYESIRLLFNQIEDDYIHYILDTVAMIDECYRMDKMFSSEFQNEGIDIKEIKMEEEIEKMILADIEYWKFVFVELEDTLIEMEYEEYYQNQKYEDYVRF